MQSIGEFTQGCTSFAEMIDDGVTKVCLERLARRMGGPESLLPVRDGACGRDDPVFL